MSYPEIWDGVSPSRPNPDVHRAPDGQDWSHLIHEHMIFPKAQDADLKIDEIDVKVNSFAMYHLYLTDLVVNMTDADAAGCHGSVKIFGLTSDRPHCIMGPKTALSFTVAGDIASDADFVFALGSQPTAVDNATLLTTEADLIGSTAGTFVASVDSLSPSSLSIKSIGATDGIYLNLAVAGDDATGDGTITVTGRVSFLWSPWYTP